MLIINYVKQLYSQKIREREREREMEQTEKKIDVFLIMRSQLLALVPLFAQCTCSAHVISVNFN